MINERISTGTVKWFSKEKGYGFITDQDKIDHFFDVSDIVGEKIPPIGSTVAFTSVPTSKKPRAKKIEVVFFREEASRYETCNTCGKQMVPRLIIHQGEATHSVCPFCGKTHRQLIGPPLWAVLLIGLLRLCANIVVVGIKILLRVFNLTKQGK